MDLWTYKDAVDSLLAFVGSSTGTIARQDCRRAARDAVREILSVHKWSYYYRPGRITTVASYSTGTITYTHTGGTYERQLTLASGTWPSWAASGSVLISSVFYDVFERKSDTVLTLQVSSNPGANVAAGTTYSISRDNFPLPEDCVSIDRLRQQSNNFSLGYVHPRDWLRDQRLFKTPSEPRLFTVIGDPNYQGTLAVRFSPAPSSANAYDFVYRRRPRELRVEEYNTGTVTVNGASATVTGVGTAFTAQHVGSVIRLGSATSAPTGRDGSNPFAVERVILSRTSTTVLVCDVAFPDSLAAVKYTLSDPVDIDPQIMQNLYQRTCEKLLAQHRRPQDRQLIAQAYQEELMRACGADNRWDGTRVVGQSERSGWLDRATLGKDEA